MNNAFNNSRKFTGFCKRFYSKGQGMTEYLIILGLIAIAAITVFTLYGSTLRSTVSGMAQELSGNDNATSLANSKANALAAEADGNKKKGMATYGNAAK